MHNWSKYAVRLLAVAALVIVADAAVAQLDGGKSPLHLRTPKAAAAPRSAQAPSQPEGTSEGTPQSTTATYADWVVQCVTRPGPPQQQACDMAQVTEVRGKNTPFSRVFLSYPGRGGPAKLNVQLPVNVSLSKEVHIQAADSDPGITSPFSRCVPAGCFAEFELSQRTLTAFRSTRGVGKLLFTDAAGRQIVVPLLFKGFSDALDALAKQ